MPVPPPTLHLTRRASLKAAEAMVAVHQSLARVEQSRLLLSRPMFPTYTVQPLAKAEASRD